MIFALGLLTGGFALWGLSRIWKRSKESYSRDIEDKAREIRYTETCAKCKWFKNYEPDIKNLRYGLLGICGKHEIEVLAESSCRSWREKE